MKRKKLVKKVAAEIIRIKYEKGLNILELPEPERSRYIEYLLRHPDEKR